MRDDRTAIDALRRDPSHAAVLMDFDGTLSEIVDHPDDAVPVPGVVELLHRLVGAYGRVGIVSGRPITFLRDRLPVDGLALVGQYGLERWIDGSVVIDDAARPYAAAVAAAADQAATALPGVYVERKGAIALTLHWRTRPDLGARAEEWARGRAAELGLGTYPTKMAVELRPPVAIDKGHGVEALATGMRTALFAGDDHGDLSGFGALDRMVGLGVLDAAIKVAVYSAEAPAELIANADMTVDGPRSLTELLATLVEN